VSEVRHTGVAGAAAAFLLHGAILWALLASPDRAPPRAGRSPARVRLAVSPPPAAPEPPPEPTRPARSSAVGAAPRETPPSSPAPVPAQVLAPRRFAVSMEATVPGGGVAVPATPGPAGVRGDPTAPLSAPVGDAPADPTAVDRLPRLVRQPGADDMRALYPEAARRDGLEGDVLLEILVSASGEVEEVRVARGAGHGFDEVARGLASRMRFEPATRAGRPVPVWIPWTWKFRLDA